MIAIVAIMATLKKKGGRNCCNYGNFETRTVHYGNIDFNCDAIMAILKIILLTPYAHNCCNYGNSEKNK